MKTYRRNTKDFGCDSRGTKQCIRNSAVVKASNEKKKCHDNYIILK